MSSPVVDQKDRRSVSEGLFGEKSLKEPYLTSQGPGVGSEINEEVRKSQQILDDYNSAARQAWVRQSFEDTEFEAGVQWTPKQIEVLQEMRQAPIVVNVIKPAVAQAVAMLTFNSPRFQATATEDSDVGVGRHMSDLMHNVWYQSNGDSEFKLAVHDYYTRGLGIMMAFFDPARDMNNGEVVLRSVNPWHVYCDGDSSDLFWRDAAHILISETLTKERLYFLLPEYKDIIDKANASTGDEDKPPQSRSHEGDEELDQTSQEAHTKLRTIDRYTKDRLPFSHVYDETEDEDLYLNDQEYTDWRNKIGFRIYSTFNSEPVIISSDSRVAMFSRIFEQTGGIFHLDQEGNVLPGEETENGSLGSTQVMEQIKLGDLIDDGTYSIDIVHLPRIYRVLSVGDQLVYSGYMDLDEYPVIPMMNHFNRNPYPLSDVRFVKGLQQYLNKTHSLIMAHAANATNVKVFIDRSNINAIDEIEKKFSKAGVGVMAVDFGEGGKNVVIAAPISLPNELYKNMADKKAEIENILGIYAFGGGDPQNAPSTKGGTLALDEFNQRRIKSKRDDIEASLTQLGKIVVQLIQSGYTEYKLVKLLQPNNKSEFIEINKSIYDELTGEEIGKLNDPSIGRYDIKVVSGSTLPSNRWAIAEYYLELMNAGVIDRVEVLKKTDVADADEVNARMSETLMYKQAYEAATEEIKRLNGDMQTLERGLKTADRQTEREKTKTKLNEIVANLDATAQLTKQRLNDSLKELRRATAPVGTS